MSGFVSKGVQPSLHDGACTKACSHTQTCSWLSDLLLRAVTAGAHGNTTAAIRIDSVCWEVSNCEVLAPLLSCTGFDSCAALGQVATGVPGVPRA